MPPLNSTTVPPESEMKSLQSGLAIKASAISPNVAFAQSFNEPFLTILTPGVSRSKPEKSSIADVALSISDCEQPERPPAKISQVDTTAALNFMLLLISASYGLAIFSQPLETTQIFILDLELPEKNANTP